MFAPQPPMKKLTIEETQEESARAMIKIPPKDWKPNYKFTHWIPTGLRAELDPSECPLVVSTKFQRQLALIRIADHAITCVKCKRKIIPKLNKNYGFVFPKACTFCKFTTESSPGESVLPKPTEQKKPSGTASILQRLDQKLDNAFKKYEIFGDFMEKPEYFENVTHKKNHAIYLEDTIVVDATEVKVLIDGLVSFHGYKEEMFSMHGELYTELYQNVLDNREIGRLHPYFTLLTTASRVVKAFREYHIPIFRGPRQSAANLTNVMEGQPKVEQSQ